MEQLNIGVQIFTDIFFSGAIVRFLSSAAASSPSTLCPSVNPRIPELFQRRRTGRNSLL